MNRPWRVLDSNVARQVSPPAFSHSLDPKEIKQWCEDINQVQSDVTYDFVFVDEESFNRYSPKSFADLVVNFRQYKDE